MAFKERYFLQFNNNQVFISDSNITAIFNISWIFGIKSILVLDAILREGIKNCEKLYYQICAATTMLKCRPDSAVLMVSVPISAWSKTYLLLFVSLDMIYETRNSIWSVKYSTCQKGAFPFLIFDPYLQLFPFCNGHHNLGNRSVPE